jgi:hypothetical protein
MERRRLFALALGTCAIGTCAGVVEPARAQNPPAKMPAANVQELPAPTEAPKATSSPATGAPALSATPLSNGSIVISPTTFMPSTGEAMPMQTHFGYYPTQWRAYPGTESNEGVAGMFIAARKKAAEMSALASGRQTFTLPPPVLPPENPVLKTAVVTGPTLAPSTAPIATNKIVPTDAISVPPILPTTSKVEMAPNPVIAPVSSMMREPLATPPIVTTVDFTPVVPTKIQQIADPKPASLATLGQFEVVDKSPPKIVSGSRPK